MGLILLEDLQVLLIIFKSPKIYSLIFRNQFPPNIYKNILVLLQMKKIWWTVIVIVAVIVFVLIIKNQQNQIVEEELAKCIGENSVLYVQFGCHACEIQEDMFGDYVDYLEIIDCFYKKGLCAGITSTPTWEINGARYKGVQSIDKLKELTGC